jgi:hypothetical protein
MMLHWRQKMKYVTTLQQMKCTGTETGNMQWNREGLKISKFISRITHGQLDEAQARQGRGMQKEIDQCVDTAKEHNKERVGGNESTMSTSSLIRKPKWPKRLVTTFSMSKMRRPRAFVLLDSWTCFSMQWTLVHLG